MVMMMQMREHTGTNNFAAIQQLAVDWRDNIGCDMIEVKTPSQAAADGSIPYVFICPMNGFKGQQTTALDILKEMEPLGALEKQGLHGDHMESCGDGTCTFFGLHVYDPRVQVVHDLVAFFTLKGEGERDTNAMTTMLNCLFRRASDPLIGNSPDFCLRVSHLVSDAAPQFFMACRIVLVCREKEVRASGMLQGQPTHWVLRLEGSLDREAECKFHYWQNHKRVCNLNDTHPRAFIPTCPTSWNECRVSWCVHVRMMLRSHDPTMSEHAPSTTKLIPTC
jgi:hypothetical protein